MTTSPATESTTIRSWTLFGDRLIPVDVEVSLLRRLPAVMIAGLHAFAAKETAERVRSAIEATGFRFPRSRVVVNVKVDPFVGGDADRPVQAEGTGLDLAIAVGVLVAGGLLEAPPSDVSFFGELSLSGEIRPVRGTVALALRIGPDAAVVDGSNPIVLASNRCRVAARLRDLVAFNSKADAPAFFVLPPEGLHSTDDIGLTQFPVATPTALDTAEIRDLDQSALHGIALALVTRRPLVLVGEPGMGRSMIARRIPFLRGPLVYGERATLVRVQDAAGMAPEALPVDRPFRAPHHTATVAGLVGDRKGRPGEVALADHGVLCLDDVQEFSRETLAAVSGALAARPGVTLVGLVGEREWTEPSTQSRVLRPFANAIVVKLRKAPGSGHWPTAAEIRSRFL